MYKSEPLGTHKEEWVHVQIHIFNISSKSSGPIVTNLTMHELGHSELLKFGTGIPLGDKRRENVTNLKKMISSQI